MSTQTGFDLSGLMKAIESSNSSYQAALFAEHAEVQIIDGDSIGQAPRVLSGRRAIAEWIEGMASRRLVHHIIDQSSDRTSIHFVDELSCPDGTTVIHRSVAEVANGQITQAFVTVEARPGSTELAFRRLSAPPAERRTARPRSWRPPSRRVAAQPAGHFLG